MGLLDMATNFLLKQTTNSSVTTDSISRKLPEILKTNWTNPGSFKIIEFTNPTVETKKGYDANSGYIFTTEDKEMLNLCLINATIPGLRANNTELWSGGFWTFTTGRPVIRQLVLTFRDFHNGTTDNYLYKKFIANFWFLHGVYPVEQRWTLNLVSDASNPFHNSSIQFQDKIRTLDPVNDDNVKTSILNDKKYSKPFVKTKNAMLDSISALRYDQRDNEFITFDVTFKFYLSE